MKYIKSLLLILFTLNISNVSKAQNEYKIKINPSNVYQEMIGFGAAFTWWGDRLILCEHKDEVYELMFQDLGMDIVRVKNWYYPKDYPSKTSPNSMETEYDRIMFEITNQFVQKAHEYDSNLEILMSSWGPPSGLKNNQQQCEGNLTKDDKGNFMYDAFAKYYTDVLDHISFTPDYLSIQNEPDFTTPEWITSKWESHEQTNLPGYDIALEKAYNQLKNRANRPKLIGPESENTVGFEKFTPSIEHMDFCSAYAYHPYNLNKKSTNDSIIESLKRIGVRYKEKPLLMTEYAGLDWINTALFIQQNLKYANASAFIYWKLIWGRESTKDGAMIYIDDKGKYVINPYYYLIKHFSKYIDEGYQRIDVSDCSSKIEITAFLNPDKSSITVVAVNADNEDCTVKLAVPSQKIIAIKGFQSVENSCYNQMVSLDIKKLLLSSNSISTFIITIEK